MLLHHIKLAFRNIFRNKILSSINILGLAIGIAASFMMFLIVSHEMSYDKHITNIERKGRIVIDEHIHKKIFTEISPRVTPTLKEYAPFLDKIGRVKRMGCKIDKENANNLKLIPYFIDKSIIDILSIQLLNGNVSEEINTVVISDQLASSLFDEKKPIGKVIEVKFGNQEYSLKITGIYSDIPETSTFKANMLFPMSLGEKVIQNFPYNKNRDVFNDWKSMNCVTYFELNNYSTFEELDEQLLRLSQKEFPADLEASLLSQKLTDMYFESGEFGREGFPRGDKQKIFILLGISILILIIATVNFILLNVSKILKRVEEIGIRKVVGATSASLILYSIIEAFVSGILSIPIIFLIVQSFFPSLIDLINLKMDVNQFEFWRICLLILLFVTSVGAISGLLIALPTSKAKAIIAIRGSNFQIKNNLLLRRFYITTQIAIAVFLLFAVIVVKEQISSFFNSDVGFDGTNLFAISSWDPRFSEKIDVLENELKKISNVEDITAAMELPPQSFGMIQEVTKNNSKDEKVPVWFTGVDYNFIKTMKMELIEGRDFSKDFSTDKKEAFILNETAMKELEIGTERSIQFYNEQKKIIGVVKDYNIASRCDQIMPVIIQLASTQMMHDVILRISNKNIAQTITDIGAVLNNIIPDVNYSYQFYDEKLNVVYKDELKFSQLIDIATVLALILTSLGILGITLFITQEKTKEIGIRKVLGASITNLVAMLSKEFILLVGIGVLVASPFAYYVMNKWLDNFAYKIEIGFGTVIFAGILALLITLSTVGTQALRAAIANPVESLRDE